MFKTTRRFAITTIASALIVGALAIATPAVAATPVGGGNHVTTVGNTTVSSSSPITNQAQLTAFEASATPKVITIDPATNTVRSVTETSGTVQPNGVNNPCQTGDLCWTAAKTPYANFGFTGVGTYQGQWVWRSTLYSHNWGGQAAYTIGNSGAVSYTPTFGHNSTINFSNPTTYNIQGIQVQITG